MTDGYRIFKNILLSIIIFVLTACNHANPVPDIGISVEYTTSWQGDMVVDCRLYSLYRENSIAVNANGIFISCYDDFNDNLVFMNAQTCDIKIIDNDGFISSIALENNNIYIAYYETINDNLMLAKSTDTGTTWEKTIIDSEGNVGSANSIAINGNNIYISYIDHAYPSDKVKFAISEDSGSTWQIEEINNNICNIYSYTSIGNDGNNIYIAYLSPLDPSDYWSDSILKCAYSPDKGQTWTLRNVDTQNPLEKLSLVAFGSSINICYYKNAANYREKLNFARSIDNGSSWEIINIDTGDYYNLSMDMLNDNLFILYGKDKLNLAKSTDSGQTWDLSLIKDNIDSINGLCTAVYNDTLYFNHGGSSMHIGESDDQGISWDITEHFGNIGVGKYNSISVDIHYTYISYYDEIDSNLKVAKLEIGEIFGSYAEKDIYTIDEDGKVGKYTSIDTENGSVYISYYDETNKDLKFAKSNDYARNWQTETVDSLGDIGEYTSIDVNNNFIYISYYDSANGYLKCSISDDFGENWQSSVIDNTSDAGQFTSIKSNQDNVYISYYDVSNTNLKFAKSINNGDNWQTATIDDLGDVGSYSSIDSLGNNIYIAYYDITDGGLKLAFSQDKGESWDKKTIDSNGDVGIFCTLVLESDEIYISYYDSSSSMIKLAYSVDGGENFIIKTIDTSYNLEGYNSLDIFNNEYYLCYYENDYQSLRIKKDFIPYEVQE